MTLIDGQLICLLVVGLGSQLHLVLQLLEPLLQGNYFAYNIGYTARRFHLNILSSVSSDKIEITIAEKMMPGTHLLKCGLKNKFNRLCLLKTTTRLKRRKKPGMSWPTLGATVECIKLEKKKRIDLAENTTGKYLSARLIRMWKLPYYTQDEILDIVLSKSFNNLMEMKLPFKVHTTGYKVIMVHLRSR